MFQCHQCHKMFGPGDLFFDVQHMTPKYYRIDPKTKKIEHYYCSPHCSLNWHERNKP